MNEHHSTYKYTLDKINRSISQSMNVIKNNLSLISFNVQWQVTSNIMLTLYLSHKIGINVVQFMYHPTVHFNAFLCNILNHANKTFFFKL